MPDKKESLNLIINEISALSSAKFNQERLSQLSGFIDSTINGDTPAAHLTIDANLTRGKQGVIVYILTNIRLIKIDIDVQEIKSISFLLDKVIGVERKLVDGDKAEVLVSFENESFGLRYPAKNQNITDFFQKVDQYRIKGSC